MSNNAITFEKLTINPLLAYTISIPSPEFCELSEYEKKAFPAILGNVTGLSIGMVKTDYYKLGKVLSLDATPIIAFDPVIIFSPIGRLLEYYKVWGRIMSGSLGFYRKKKIKEYDEAIKIFRASARGCGLSLHETTFATIEMLKFKNDVLLNPLVR